MNGPEREEHADLNGSQVAALTASPETCQSIEWYSEGQTRIVEVGGIRISVRLIGRKGRRARIAITAPAGATFRSLDLN